MIMGILSNLRWKPSGRRLYRLEDLKDGMGVEAIAYYQTGAIRRRIMHGIIEFQQEAWFSGEAVVYLKDLQSSFIAHLGYLKADGTADPKFNHMADSLICTKNLIKEHEGMANKLLGLIKLNKNQRRLQRVGIYDENGNLTIDGQEVVLNLIAKDLEDKLVELSKDWKTDKKDKSDEE